MRAISIPARRRLRSAITRRRAPGTRARRRRDRITDWRRRLTAIYHDATNSESGFVSLIRNQTPKDQLRVDGQYREDYFQVPYDPDANDYECDSDYYCSAGLRDGQTERDSFVIANWVHTISPKALVSVAPFYHFNQSDYDSLASRPAGSDDVAPGLELRRGAGGSAASMLGWNSFSGGLYSFYSRGKRSVRRAGERWQRSVATQHEPANANAGLVEFYLGDHLRLGQVCDAAGRRTVLDLPSRN